MRDSLSHSKKIQAVAKNLRKRNNYLTSEDRKKDVRATIRSGKLKAVVEYLAGVKAKLAAGRVEGGNSR